LSKTLLPNIVLLVLDRHHPTDGEKALVRPMSQISPTLCAHLFDSSPNLDWPAGARRYLINQGSSTPVCRYHSEIFFAENPATENSTAGMDPTLLEVIGPTSNRRRIPQVIWIPNSLRGTIATDIPSTPNLPRCQPIGPLCCVVSKRHGRTM
jgi:hypothetical protein